MDSAKTDAGPGHLLGARGPLLALVQRHHRDARLRAAHAHRARPEGPATRRAGAVAAPQQEAQPVEVDARHRRGDLLAGPVPEGGGRARRARGGARSRSAASATDVRVRARQYTGKKNQLVVPGRRGRRRSATSTVMVEKSDQGLRCSPRPPGTSRPRSCPTEERGDFFPVSRTLLQARERPASECVLKPLAEGATLAPGDEVEVQLSLRASTRPSTCTCATRARPASSRRARCRASSGTWASAGTRRSRDSGTNFFFEQLPAGEYTFKYRLRANMAGTFRVGPGDGAVDVRAGVHRLLGGRMR